MAARLCCLDHVPAEELGPTENENLHTLELMVLIRQAEPDDYGRVVAVVDEWWGGRPMAAMLPKLFFIHFHDTSFVAEDEGSLTGFLCGFRSQTFADEAYIHFVGVDPATRGSGLGRTLYERFFAAVAPRTVVRAVTSPVNERSVAFHEALGFEVERIDPAYDGVGEPRVLLVKRLA
jgi:ribosomal protein S18 acetylase RimI-like enzyme